MKKLENIPGSVLIAALMAALVFWQYLTVSNIPLSRAWSSDTLPYGRQFSLLPLSPPFSSLIGFASPVAFFPLGTILRSGELKLGDAWQRHLGAALFPPSHGVQAGFAVFVAINSAFWFLVATAILLGVRSRRRSSHVRARMHRQIGCSIICLLGIAGPPSLKGDIVGDPPPTFEQQFSASKIVALARIEAGAIGLSSSQIYRARVTVSFKGVEKDRILYFWGGNIGSAAYGVGEVYLLMLRKAWKPVADVLASFAPPGESLYEAVCLNGPILLWRSMASPPPPPIFPTDQSVFLFGCPEPPFALHAHALGQSAVLFHSWVTHDEMFEYLKKLALASTAKSRAGA